MFDTIVRYQIVVTLNNLLRLVEVYAGVEGIVIVNVDVIGGILSAVCAVPTFSYFLLLQDFHPAVDVFRHYR